MIILTRMVSYTIMTAYLFYKQQWQDNIQKVAFTFAKEPWIKVHIQAVVLDFLKIIDVVRVTVFLSKMSFALRQENIFSLKKHRYAFVIITRNIVVYPVFQEYFCFLLRQAHQFGLKTKALFIGKAEELQATIPVYSHLSKFYI